MNILKITTVLGSVGAVLVLIAKALGPEGHFDGGLFTALLGAAAPAWAILTAKQAVDAHVEAEHK